MTARTVAVYFLLAVSGAAWPQEKSVGTESPAVRAQRHQRVAERRNGVEIICHRGAQEFAHENTLEAYRAALELGADGNEIDIRATRDGVLVCFHDDMLDRLLAAYGTVREMDWETLRSFRFRDPGRYGDQCRIPTLAEVFELHRRYAGLIHLDIKEPGQDTAMTELLDRMDMWDHIAFCGDNAAAIVKDPRLRLSRYKGGLYEDRGEVDPARIAAVLQQPGNGVIVEDPRGVLVALGRKLGTISTEPVAPMSPRPAQANFAPPIEVLIATVRDAPDWNVVAESATDRAAAGAQIRARAQAAELLLTTGATTPEVFAVLEDRVRHRSLHKDWMFHGLDGSMALRALIRLHAPNAVSVARDVLWLDDPALEPVHDKQYKTPRSWTDFRMKMQVFPSLANLPGLETERLCRDYLALSADEARKIGPPQFEEAARTLLTVSPNTETSLELLRHRESVVRGRAILVCLAWPDSRGEAALQETAPFALDYRLPMTKPKP